MSIAQALLRAPEGAAVAAAAAVAALGEGDVCFRKAGLNCAMNP